MNTRLTRCWQEEGEISLLVADRLQKLKCNYYADSQHVKNGEKKKKIFLQDTYEPNFFSSSQGSADFTTPTFFFFLNNDPWKER